ncbi:MAG: class I SAM-dependent methyltransferase [Betaproteobacteria bacterium]|nr:MAG: class I SAM-dependent methyltransferase [Betaproteobacteria bacterium]
MFQTHRTNSSEPSVFVVKHACKIRDGSTLLDVACGSGRHAIYFARRGVHVTAVDRDPNSLQGLESHDNIRTELRDLEGDSLSDLAWPYPAQSFDTVLVCNYLWRPTLARLIDTVRIGGFLIYETYMEGHEQFGRPSRAEFLLRSNELLDRTREQFRVLAYEEGLRRDERTGDSSVKQFYWGERLK